MGCSRHECPCRSKRKDHGYAWVVLAAVFLCQVICMGIPYSAGVLTVAFRDEYNGTLSETTWAASINNGLSVGAAPAASYFSRKFGFRQAALLGSFLTAAGLLASAFAQQLWVHYITFGVVAGTGAAFVYMPTATILPTYFEKKLLFAYGVLAAGAGVGSLVLPIVQQTILDASSLRACLIFLTCLSLVQFPAAFLIFPLSLRPGRACHRGSIHTAPSRCQPGSTVNVESEAGNKRFGRQTSLLATVEKETQNTRVGRKLSMLAAMEEKENSSVDGLLEMAREEEECPPPKRQPVQHPKLVNQASVRDMLPPVATKENLKVLLKSPDLWAYAAASFFFQAGVNTVYVLISETAGAEFDIDAGQGAFLLTIIGIAVLASQAFLSFLGFVHPLRPYGMYCFALLSFTVITGFIPVVTSYECLCLLCALFGFSYGLQIALVVPLTHDLFGEDSVVEALGIALFFQSLGLLAGPPLTGYFGDRRTYAYSYYMACAFDVISLLLTLWALHAEIRALFKAKQMKCEESEEFTQPQVVIGQ